MNYIDESTVPANVLIVFDGGADECVVPSCEVDALMKNYGVTFDTADVYDVDTRLFLGSTEL